MTILEFEDYYGNTLALVTVKDLKKEDIIKLEGVNIADIEKDNKTNELKIRLQMEEVL